MPGQSFPARVSRFGGREPAQERRKHQETAKRDYSGPANGEEFHSFNRATILTWATLFAASPASATSSKDSLGISCIVAIKRPQFRPKVKLPTRILHPNRTGGKAMRPIGAFRDLDPLIALILLEYPDRSVYFFRPR